MIRALRRREITGQQFQPLPTHLAASIPSVASPDNMFGNAPFTSFTHDGIVHVEEINVMFLQPDMVLCMCLLSDTRDVFLVLTCEGTVCRVNVAHGKITGIVVVYYIRDMSSWGVVSFDPEHDVVMVTTSFSTVVWRASVLVSATECVSPVLMLGDEANIGHDINMYFRHALVFYNQYCIVIDKETLTMLKRPYMNDNTICNMESELSFAGPWSVCGTDKKVAMENIVTGVRYTIPGTNRCFVHCVEANRDVVVVQHTGGIHGICAHTIRTLWRKPHLCSRNKMSYCTIRPHTVFPIVPNNNTVLLVRFVDGKIMATVECPGKCTNVTLNERHGRMWVHSRDTVHMYKV
jgi:hypothetical protein